MSAEHFEKVQDLFESALLLDEAQRDQFLDKKCGKNKKLQDDLRTLLSAQKLVDNVMPRVGNQHLRLAQTDSPYNLVGPYQIIKTLGSGGMGVVYKAFDIRLERYVALKFLPDILRNDEHAKKRLIREAKAASALDHHNICTIYDIGEYNDEQLYIAMAYYAGASLEQYMLQQKFGVEKSLDIIHQLLEGLLTAHRKGIYHRDIKPANLLLTHEGNLKIVDFGIAMTKNNIGTDTGIQAGSVSYMSPEQIRGEKADAQSDLWGSAVIFYELLAGRRPFSGNSLPEIVNRVLNHSIAPLNKIRPELPAAVDRWFQRALAKNEADRFPDSESFVREFHNLENGLTTLLSVKKNMAKKSVSGMTKKPLNKVTTPSPKISIHAISSAIELSNYMNLSDDIDDDAFKNLISAYIQTLETIISEYNGYVHALHKDTFIIKYPVNEKVDADSARKAAVEASLSIQANVKGLGELHGEELQCRIALDTLLSEENEDMEKSIAHMDRILKVADESEIYIDAGLKSQLEPQFKLVRVATDKIAEEFSQLWKVVEAIPQSESSQDESQASMPAPTPIKTSVAENSKNAASDQSKDLPAPLNSEAAPPNSEDAPQNSKAAAQNSAETRLVIHQNDHGAPQQNELKHNDVENLNVENDNFSSMPLGDNENTSGVEGPFVGRLSEIDRIKNVMQQCQTLRKLHVNFISGDVGVGSKYFAKKALSFAHEYKYRTYAVAHYDFGVTEDTEPLNALVKKVLIDLHPKKLSAEHSLVSNALLLNCVDSSELPALHDLLGLSLSKAELKKYRALNHANRQRMLSETAARVIKYAAAKQALYINVYNLHLAKSESLTLMAKFLEQLQMAPIIVNFTSLRNAAKLNRFSGMCPDSIYLNNFELDGLSTAETGQLIGKSGGDVNQLEDYLPLTLGNPLHISVLAPAKAVNDQAGSLEEAIDVIVASLAENDRLALRAASVMGSCFSLEALRFLLSNPNYKITPLIECGLVEPSGRYYVFKHELIRDLIYAVVNPTSRNTLHEKAAEWYSYVDESIRAHHLQIIESDEALSSTLVAAQEKYSYCHYEDTVRLCGKGLSLARTANEIAKFSVLLGECYVKLDKADLAIEHFKSVLAQCPTDRLQCMATLGMVEACINRKEYQKAENLLDEAQFMVKDGGFSTHQARVDELNELLQLKRIEV